MYNKYELYTFVLCKLYTTRITTLKHACDCHADKPQRGVTLWRSVKHHRALQYAAVRNTNVRMYY